LVYLRVVAKALGGDIGNLLLSASRLRKFIFCGGDNKISLPESGRLPPLRELRLGSDVQSTANWNIWDFSQLRSLTIHGSDLIRYSTPQPAKVFPLLKNLSIYQKAGRQDNEPEFLGQLARVIENLNPLEELILSLDNPGVILNAMTKHGCSLKVLRMNDSPATSLIASQTMVSYYKQIQHSCVNLTALDVTVGVYPDTDDGEVRPLHHSPWILV
jgi:hypothetical protein